MDLQKKKQELEQELETAKASFHRIQGALMVVNQLIDEDNKPKK